MHHGESPIAFMYQCCQMPASALEGRVLRIAYQGRSGKGAGQQH